jgi:ABC-2 type transport system ATP-binding protein
MGIDHTADISTAKSYIGLVPQEFNFSIFEKPIDILVQQAGYYGIPRHIALVRAEKYLKELSLWEKRNVMARTLSGGMKRRLMIARALVHEPQILILDEPTAGVDIEIRRGMWDFLKSLNAAGTTIILTTHYLEEAEMLCSRVGILQAGRIVSMGTMQDILGRLEKESFVLDISRDMTDSEIADMGMYAIANTGNKTIEVCTSPVHTLNILFEMLTGYGIQVLSLRNKNNRLEEYFLQITGK